MKLPLSRFVDLHEHLKAKQQLQTGFAICTHAITKLDFGLVKETIRCRTQDQGQNEIRLTFNLKAGKTRARYDKMAAF